MMVVSDVQDVFVPLLDGFLVTLEESEFIIDRYRFFKVWFSVLRHKTSLEIIFFPYQTTMTEDRKFVHHG